MRKLIEYCLISADGVFDDPNPVEFGVGDYQDDGYLRDTLGLFESCDAILMGRGTYEVFAAIYGAGGGNPTYAERLNAIRKYVFSSTLQAADWTNSVIVRGEAATEVARLKAEPDGPLLVLGHGRLTETLLEAKLIDAIDLSIHPIIVGKGRSIFRKGRPVGLKLTATKIFSNIVTVTYEPQY